MNTLIVRGIRREQPNRLAYDYTVKGPWRKYFDKNCPMWVEYNQPVDQVPDSIAVLPLIGNVIVLASLMDADIYVDEIDKDFYECVEEFIAGYDDLMPEHVHFKHKDIVHAKKIVETPLSETEREENLLFFSGGVDATFSLVSHLEEKPALVTIWGADIPWQNEAAWERSIRFNQKTAENHGLKLLTIHSNLRVSLNDANLEQFSMNLVHDWWWPAFHCNIAMMCLAAPIACGKRKKLYFAGSFSSQDREEWGNYIVASDPRIDNHVRFCGCRVIHDGYEACRHEKVKKICEYYGPKKEKPYIRVCYQSDTGKNCGKCEKCVRTMMSILLEDGDPREYGFQYDESKFNTYFAAGIEEIAKCSSYSFLSFYTGMRAAYRSKYTLEQVPEELRTFYESELETIVARKQEEAERERQQAAAAASRMTGIRKLIFKVGEKTINHVWPGSSWKQEYNRLRWWHICSSEYRDTIKPWFERMLEGYQGELFSRGWRIRLDYRLCWLFLGAEPDDYFDYEFFRKGWRWRNHHITKQRLNFMDPVFNDPERARVISNKPDFYRTWGDCLKRAWCIPQEVTAEEFRAHFEGASRVLVKPVADFGGHGIEVLDVEPEGLAAIYERLHARKDAIIAEEFVEQRGFLHDVYPAALNPIRVTTLRRGERIDVLYAFFTAGCKGSRIANDCSGGIVFPIDTRTGRLGIGQGRETNAHDKHPDTGVQVDGEVVPGWERVKAFACEAHRHAPEGLRLIGWDICLSDGELSLIEGNRTPGFPELPDREENQWKQMKAYLREMYPDRAIVS